MPRTRTPEPTGPDPNDPDEQVELGEEVQVVPWTPDAGDFINLKGKAYLPARRRVQWMRGIPVPHPDWSIDTKMLHFDRGTLKKVGTVEGGYAMFRAELYDVDGRLVSVGTKTEYSENFADFVEKAETGAIARCLAIAGYGTESALDIDEGMDKERIADAPVAINITASNVPDIRQGGRSSTPTQVQVNELAAVARTLDWGPDDVAAGIKEYLALEVSPYPDEGTNAKKTKAIVDFLRTRTFEEVGGLIAFMQDTAKDLEESNDDQPTQ